MSDSCGGHHLKHEHKWHPLVVGLVGHVICPGGGGLHTNQRVGKAGEGVPEGANKEQDKGKKEQEHCPPT